MKHLHINPSENIQGEITMPQAKIHSFRALLWASMAQGTSIIRNPKISNDWSAAIEAMKLFGAKIKQKNNSTYEVTGVAGKPKTPSKTINVNNSGTMLAYAIGIAAACSGQSIITGDKSIQTKRKIIKNVIKPLKKLGVNICSIKNNGMPPFMIKGPIKGGITHMDGTGCQPVFSILISAALCKKPVELFVKNSGELGYIDTHLYWIKKVGLTCKNKSYKHYSFLGNQIPKSFDAKIPFSWSTPGYPLLAALITSNSKIVIRNMDLDDPYPDKHVITILKKMGADLAIEKNRLVAKSSKLKGINIDMNSLPDQIPTIAVAACFAKGKTTIKNVLTARWKECDRIAAVCKELKKMGAKITEKKDGLIINQDGTWHLKGTTINGYHDHRMVMAFSIAGLASKGKTIISDAQMIEKSFKNYIQEMKKAGAKFSLTKEEA